MPGSFDGWNEHKQHFGGPRGQMNAIKTTIKSGKTRLLNDVLPGLLAAQHAAEPRKERPFIVKYEFPLNIGQPEFQKSVNPPRSFGASGVIRPPPNIIYDIGSPNSIYGMRVGFFQSGQI
jgi:hypothetical protein